MIVPRSTTPRVPGSKDINLGSRSSLYVCGSSFDAKNVVHSFSSIQVKSSRRDTLITTTFKGESGCMNAIVSCKDHDHSKRDIYDLCETNEGGEVSVLFLIAE